MDLQNKNFKNLRRNLSWHNINPRNNNCELRRKSIPRKKAQIDIQQVF